MFLHAQEKALTFFEMRILVIFRFERPTNQPRACFGGARYVFAWSLSILIILRFLHLNRPSKAHFGVSQYFFAHLSERLNFFCNGVLVILSFQRPIRKP